jgi:hypothetical protein
VISLISVSLQPFNEYLLSTFDITINWLGPDEITVSGSDRITILMKCALERKK